MTAASSCVPSDSTSDEPRHVWVPAIRIARWLDNFAARHGEPRLAVVDGTLTGESPDGSTYVAALPFGRLVSPEAGADLEAGVGALVAGCAPPSSWGVLLVRKGGFAVAQLVESAIVGDKIGRRHVQGRTKAGGQSQQRFARRRANQVQAAYDAATEHAVRLLGSVSDVVVGGDRTAVTAVLGDPRLAHVIETSWWIDVPDPRRAQLDAAIERATSVKMTVVNR